MGDPRQQVEAFRKAWPIERLRTMTLDEYCSVGNDDAYCYWLEFKVVDAGGIGGGSSYKFGVFKRKESKIEAPNRAYDNDGTYWWVKKYGDTAAAVFQTIRAGLVEVAEAASRGNLAEAAEPDLPPVLKWKTAFLYQDFVKPILVCIFWEKAMKFLAFGDPSARRTLAEAHAELMKRKPADLDIFEYGNGEWARWTEFQGSVGGLIASDGHPWKDEYVEALAKGGHGVIWWSKRPSGQALVANQLEKIINGEGSFPFYLTSNGVVTHKARVIDVAFESTYDSKKARWAGAYGYQDSFDDYSDDTKSARIAFLVDEMRKLDGSLKPGDFEYWNKCSPPVHENLQPIVGLRTVVEEDDDRDEAEPTVALPSRNVIFYGPPGTGKTWYLRTELFGRFTRVSAGKSRAQWMIEETDALAWWKVVAAALLDAGPSTVPAIAEHEYIRAKIETTVQANPRAMIWSMLQQHTFEDCELVKYSKRADPALFRKGADSVWSVDPEAVRDAVPEVEAFVSKAGDYSDTDQNVVRNYEFITFHQSMSYEDFIEGIKPVAGEELGEPAIGYKVKDGVFKQICRRARLDPGNEYALFIDEINRGNVAGIFGELITLIEEDKRQGAEAELSAVLPYSRESFTVPRNLYVVGTMNSADRSVEALDTALRRRFAFVEMPPNIAVLQEVEGVDLARLLDAVNRRLEALRDRDHRIGHAYLIGVASLESLKAAFADRILPLLQEYFYGDWSRVGMVLGSAFVRPSAKKPAWPRGFEGDAEASASEVWEITDASDWTADSFRSIYA